MDMWSLVDIIFVGAGLYMFYGAYAMKASGDIKANFLLPKDVEPRKCKDAEGYCGFILPRLLIFAAVTLLTGAAGLVNTYVQPLGVAYYICMAVFMAALIWFALVSKKSVAMFW